ncbi:uncharacterized protein [Venturia canescens]|uniref:uncharacterized protein n=1 Tax=Venturia canescens TaxID=32260 RepID=UPI001C9C7312|nr:uncharacterized protein LOC122418229 [Venturia canescens]XP_043288272.1 uncharacterized protein LOC122418229 [Venturia canescens]
MSDDGEENQHKNLNNSSLNPTIQQVEDVSIDFDKSKEASIEDEYPFSVPGTSACKASTLKTELSRGPNGDHKKNVCLYCKKPQSKIARHLEFVHQNEEKVKIFASLPPKDPKRLRLIGLLRKKGNYMHLDRKNNTNGLLVPVRRPRDPNKSSGDHYAPCPKCLGMYTKNNLRHHICGDEKATTKGILLEAKRVAAQVHEQASVKMRRDILPRLAEDEIGNTAKFDKLIVLYGNDMGTRYKRQYLESMVRSQLRLLSRFLITIKGLDKNITDMASVFDPKYYKQLIKAMEIMGQLDPSTTIYKTPAVVYNLQIALRKVADVLIRESIQDHDEIMKKNAKDMLKLMNQGFVNTVNKTVTESQVEMKRQKAIVLPKTADIRKLSEYLATKMDDSYKLLLNAFSDETWRVLAEITLIYIMIYNRKRPGELERMMKLDYNNIQGITEDDEEYQQLSTEGKNAANKYVRVEIRGKLNRVVPVLLNQRMKKSVDLILAHAKRAGVSSKNPYVFGIPSDDKNRFAFLRATTLLRRFASECGASNPESLRGTNLRKHMATKCVNMNLEKKQTEKVAHFLGHDPNIHTSIYQQRKTSDILLLSKYLEKAQGRGSISASDLSQDCSTGQDTTANADITNGTG